ncbi:hypothetical protein EV356DRAFT_444901 [Viridothelium virens]|uniref:L-ornithine N(5)-monooxygenase [NAD(P)H] n=1 Tax=Viridothelium virens TaxID=1048519 RepID=A0A6A6HBD0_VIRVR|nr:hypothetical protein EV356DRAFT_444901 [Viridothelium virens]
MAPHAESSRPTTPNPACQSNHIPRTVNSTGTVSQNLDLKGKRSDHRRSHLRQTEPDELHDLICVGFGPASLAIAIALHDALDDSVAEKNLFRTSGQRPKVAFLERQPQFAWHAGMILPGAKMQITFIKDLATMRNPRSEFTFLNYLHTKGRLAQFTNLSTFLPQRMEYEDYMRWCAGWFDEVVTYSQDVIEIAPEYSDRATSEAIRYFTVKSKDVRTGTIIERRARHVVIAVGGKPNIPRPLPAKHQNIVHSANYATAIPKLLSDTQKSYEIAVVGSGQSAAEVFHNLQKQYPNSRTKLLIRGNCLRPSDDSPFVNEIFGPERIDTFYQQSPSTRTSSLSQDRCTNYGVVRLELLEAIYSDLYTQRLQYSSHEDEWPHRILNNSVIEGWGDLPDGRIALHVYDEGDYGGSKGVTARKQTLEFDVVIVATGYRRDAHENLLQPTRHLLADSDGVFQVGRNYRVKFSNGTVSDDVGVWLQGCNENTHGLSDTLLSVLATRGGEMVQSIFGSAENSPTRLGG